jgi:hypothetical protein
MENIKNILKGVVIRATTIQRWSRGSLAGCQHVGGLDAQLAAGTGAPGATREWGIIVDEDEDGDHDDDPFNNGRAYARSSHRTQSHLDKLT